MLYMYVEKLKKNFNSGKVSGQSLIEVVFVMGVVVLLLSGLVVATIFNVKMARYSKNKATATRVAREQVELVKTRKQSAEFWTDLTEQEVDLGEVTDNFFCKIVYSNIQGDSKKQVDLAVKVWWDSPIEPTEGKKNQVLVTTIISNWEQ